MQLTIENSVGTVVLDRPPVNAWDDQQLELMEDAIDVIKKADLSVVVVRSKGPHFSAGADIKVMVAALESGEFQRLDAFVSRIQRVNFEWEQVPVPTLAVLQGAVVGGGLEFALACDLRIATTSARLGLPEVRLGLLPGGGGTQRLTRLAGRGRALRMMLTGELIDGDVAERWGIVDWCVPAEELDAKTEEVVAAIVDVAGPAQSAIKRSVERYNSAIGYLTETAEQRVLHGTQSTRNRLNQFVSERK
ncbi:enoyl-CoA hydratase/isomerase family protein [Ferrimicrobium acidiphilum]|uniref:Putative enoyl-CoA hydratase echA8 n=1 Tax=Ferrimicrobium acidiphilum DSM 19497 TaxID=1121877 RepID=A0A0D8FQ90_9ACTN|nr:enoyl-CoA hydratase/isomerase family protein [Ferrimicrobium acidiphilum]KJE75443.1 putative enoyl-CoA hydratase echA8 [Ferrimicrobium acidiphilum DSM 19497]